MTTFERWEVDRGSFTLLAENLKLKLSTARGGAKGQPDSRRALERLRTSTSSVKAGIGLTAGTRPKRLWVSGALGWVGVRGWTKIGLHESADAAGGPPGTRQACWPPRALREAHPSYGPCPCSPSFELLGLRYSRRQALFPNSQNPRNGRFELYFGIGRLPLPSVLYPSPSRISFFY